MKLFKLTLALLILSSSLAKAQNTGTPSTLRVKVDANNYLILTAAAQTAPISSPTVFNSIRLKTDSSNQLMVVVTGAITPTTISCSSSIGTTSTVLIGGNPCSWSGSPTITGLTTKVASRSTFAFIGQDTNGSNRFEMYVGGGGNANFYMYDGSANLWSSFGASEGLVYGTATNGNGFLKITRILGGGPSYNEIQLYPTNGDYSGFSTLATEQSFGWKFLVNEANTVKIPLTLNTDGSSIHAGNVTFATDNANDIGASGATRPRTLYAGTSIVVPTVNATTAFQVNATPITSGTTFLTSGSGMGVANVGANSCGTTTATIAGNNNLFTITVGATAGTQCRVAFTITAANAWGAVCNDDTTTIAVRTTAIDTTHVDVIGTFTAGDQVTCIAHPR